MYTDYKNYPHLKKLPNEIQDALEFLQNSKELKAAYGHMGRNSEIKTVKFLVGKEEKEFEVETFTWEKLDCQEQVKSAFGL